MIKRFEGLELTSYRDSAGVYTIGWGHTRGVKAGETIDEPTAERLLDEDILEVERSIANHVPEWAVRRLPDASFDALVSFIFNVGTQAFIRPNGSYTDFYRAVTGNDLSRVCAEMQRWVKATVNGKAVVLPGLVERRGAEAALFGKGLEPERPRQQEPKEPKTKVLETPSGAGAAAAGGAGIAATAATLTSAGRDVATGGDSTALIIGLALIMVGIVIAVWVAKR